ncbi:hypothetical protein GCM10027277_43100 [Pseudoduganella ginsengisoli]|uniref:Histone methylation protein DOT1-like protein n=1 Tax=Pseudoduganella ginsengisoli TaxID=1462440 RepID=A0A6L6Q6F3_9BURK|nr:histone methylation protein DOT1-like protein [Pseudoduganella ginsengisoli]MTW05086.1 histone methylation protein DOT1-like protein [Pseudoduganella ginsengisoli]
MAGLADVLEALQRTIEDGELHRRQHLEAEMGSQFGRHVEIGLALREAFEQPELRDKFIRRLKPLRRLIIGNLPAGVQRQGLLPELSPQQRTAMGHRRLDDIPDSELEQWLIDDGRMIYGEFKPHELHHYFTAIAPYVKPGSAMIDLGSGLGKVVLSAALSLPFGSCTGVELLPYRHAMAQQRFDAMLAAGDAALAALPGPPTPDEVVALPYGGHADASHVLRLKERVRFINGDLFDADVSQAGLIFMYCTCFAPLMDRIGEKLARELPQGCLVSTTTFQLRHPAFQEVAHFPSGTVAWTSVYLYVRAGELEGLPPAPASYLYEPPEEQWEAAVREQMAALDAGA